MSAERDELAELVQKYASQTPADWLYDDEAKHIADAILAAGYHKPRVITTIEECVALSDGAAILTKGGIIFRKYVGWLKEGKDGWIRCTFGQTDPLTIESLGYNDYAHFPATVIHEGDTK